MSLYAQLTKAMELVSHKTLKRAFIWFMIFTSAIGIGVLISPFWSIFRVQDSLDSKNEQVVVRVQQHHTPFPKGNNEQQDGGWSVIHVWNGEASAQENNHGEDKHQDVKNKRKAESLKPDSSHPDDSVRRFWSQCGQDKFIVEEIFADEPRERYFIDLAANDAQYLSNSYSLEHFYDWKGICVEANPRFHLGLAKRKCTVVSAAVFERDNEDVTFNFEPDIGEVSEDFPASLFGGIVSSSTDNLNKGNNSAKFKTVTLSRVLERFNAPKVIDYLSLDVEGAELQVLVSFPFNQWRIRVMSVERPKEELHKLLTKNGFWFLKPFSKWGETLYIHETLPNFKKVMAKHRVNSYGGESVKHWDASHSYVYSPRWSPGKGKRNRHFLRR